MDVRARARHTQVTDGDAGVSSALLERPKIRIKAEGIGGHRCCICATQSVHICMSRRDREMQMCVDPS